MVYLDLLRTVFPDRILLIQALSSAVVRGQFSTLPDLLRLLITFFGFLCLIMHIHAFILFKNRKFFEFFDNFVAAFSLLIYYFRKGSFYALALYAVFLSALAYLAIRLSTRDLKADGMFRSLRVLWISTGCLGLLLSVSSWAGTLFHWKSRALLLEGDLLCFYCALLTRRVCRRLAGRLLAAGRNRRLEMSQRPRASCCLCLRACSRGHSARTGCGHRCHRECLQGWHFVLQRKRCFCCGKGHELGRQGLAETLEGAFCTKEHSTAIVMATVAMCLLR